MTASRRLSTNPMRILDSKNSETQRLLADAPKLPDFVDAQSIEHYDGLKGLLQDLGIPFRENPNLVRGLDYYAHGIRVDNRRFGFSRRNLCGWPL